jgi:ABC-type sugar transport system substrate-binding protein
MQVLEAGGYPNLERQRSLVQACAEAADMDAVILGTVSFDGLSDLLREVSRKKPVLATVNDIADAGLAAKVGVSWYDMGRQVGEYLARLPHPGQARVPVAWFPGRGTPAGCRLWTRASATRSATAGSPSSAPAGATPTRRCSATSSRRPSTPTPRCATWWVTR